MSEAREFALQTLRLQQKAYEDAEFDKLEFVKEAWDRLDAHLRDYEILKDTTLKLYLAILELEADNG